MFWTDLNWNNHIYWFKVLLNVDETLTGEIAKVQTTLHNMLEKHNYDPAVAGPLLDAIRQTITKDSVEVSWSSDFFHQLLLSDGYKVYIMEFNSWHGLQSSNSVIEQVLITVLQVFW